MKRCVVRRVEAKSQIISTIAGNGTAGFSGDGEACNEGCFESAAYSIQFDRATAISTFATSAITAFAK